MKHLKLICSVVMIISTNGLLAQEKAESLPEIPTLNIDMQKNPTPPSDAQTQPKNNAQTEISEPNAPSLTENNNETDRKSVV